MRQAIVKDNIIINIIVWSGVTPYTPPEGSAIYPCPDEADIGWQWNNGVPSPLPAN